METVYTTNISPGALIKRELKKRKVTQRYLANALSLAPSHISEIISNKRTISTIVATRLQDFFDIPAKVWLDLQIEYKLSHKTISDEMDAGDMLSQFDIYVSLKTLFSRSNSPRRQSSIDKLDLLKSEFGIESTKQLNNCFGFFKKSEKTGLDARMLNTWTFIARRDSKHCLVKGKFDKSKLDEIGTLLSRVFHINENTINRTTHIFSDYGIRFCVTEKISNASIDGFSFIEDGVPAIVVTKRFDRIDNFAFTVLHELYHVCNHLSVNGDQRISIEGYSADKQREESEANMFALNTLIPPMIWEKAPAERPIPFLIQKTYTKWAKSNGLNKWIVLGRIAHDLGLYQMRVDLQRNIQ